jgi:hypothetical protein
VQSPFSTVAPLHISHCSKSANNIEPALYSISYPSYSTALMQPVQLGFDIHASLNLRISNPRCTEHPVLLIQQQLHLFVQPGFDIPPLTHPAVIEPALYAHHYFADSTIFVSPLTTEVRYPSALFIAKSNLCCTIPAIYHIPRTLLHQILPFTPHSSLPRTSLVTSSLSH